MLPGRVCGQADQAQTCSRSYLQQVGRHEQRGALRQLPNGPHADDHDLGARAVVDELVRQLLQHRRQHIRRHQLVHRLRGSAEQQFGATTLMQHRLWHSTPIASSSAANLSPSRDRRQHSTTVTGSSAHERLSAGPGQSIA